ncbi:MAG: hypothetical protein ABIK96_03385 [bacterium]
MKEPCPDVRMLLEAVGTGPDHPWADHLAACPRCRSLVKARDAFAADALAGADSGFPKQDEAAAAARLDGFVGALGSRRRRPTWLLPAAAVFLVAVGMGAIITHLGGGDGTLPADPETGELQMRGEEWAAETWAAPDWTVDEDVVEFTWTAFEGADDYELVVLAPDLSPAVNLEAGNALRVGVKDPEFLKRNSGGYLVVVARREGRTLARSAPAHLP